MNEAGDLTQQELKARLLPVLKEKGTAYRKFQAVIARIAEGGEIVETVTNDGHETTNQANAGDYIVKNSTMASEVYIIRPTSFSKRYIFERKLSDGYSRYLPIGEVIAITLNDEVLRIFDRQHELRFVAPWNELVLAKSGDLLVCPVDYSEIYRIARKEFGETYRKTIE